MVPLGHVVYIQHRSALSIKASILSLLLKWDRRGRNGWRKRGGIRPGLLRKKGVGEKGVVEYRWGRVFFSLPDIDSTQD